MNILIVTIKSWNLENAQKFSDESRHNIKILTKPSELEYDKIESFSPDFIFFPHWSWIIPPSIYHNYNCIVFHMTDLPYGRGGSPLQNLIVRDYKQTKISAIDVVSELDAGDVYLKYELNLHGTADEILIRASNIIFSEMIPKIIEEKLNPTQQEGKPVKFNRRKPEQSEISPTHSLKKVYDLIRMLDGEDYPRAYIDFGGLRLKFSRASYKNNRVIADVVIEEKD